MSFPVAAFYINLDRRVDRREHIEAQIGRVGLVAERVTAVMPADIEPARLAAAGRLMSPTELACSLSHRRVWQMVLDRNLPDALILEDDGVLSASIADVLRIPSLRDKVDALQFESHPANALVGPSILKAGDTTVHRLMSASLGSCAYYITAQFAARMLEHPLLDRLAVDRVLFGRGGGVIYRERIYQSVPALAVQLGAFSTGSSSAARSDLAPVRILTKRPPHTLKSRLRKIQTNAEHALQIIRSFAPTGELFGSRQLQLPIAADIKAQL